MTDIYEDSQKILQLVGFNPVESVGLYYRVIHLDTDDIKKQKRVLQRLIQHAAIELKTDSNSANELREQFKAALRDELNADQNRQKLATIIKSFIYSAHNGKTKESRTTYLTEALSDIRESGNKEHYGFLVLSFAKDLPNKLPEMLAFLSSKDELQNTLNDKYIDGGSIFSHLVHLSDPAIIRFVFAEMAKNESIISSVLSDYLSTEQHLKSNLNELVTLMLKTPEIQGLLLNWTDPKGNNLVKYIAQYHSELFISLSKVLDMESFCGYLLIQTSSTPTPAISRGQLAKLGRTLLERFTKIPEIFTYTEDIKSIGSAQQKINDSIHCYTYLLYADILSNHSNRQLYIRHLNTLSDIIRKSDDPKSIYKPEYDRMRPSEHLMTRLKHLRAIMAFQLAIAGMPSADQPIAKESLKKIITVFNTELSQPTSTFNTAMLDVINEQLLTVVQADDQNQVGTNELFKQLSLIRSSCIDTFHSSVTKPNPTTTPHQTIITAMNASINNCSAWGKVSGEKGEHKKEQLIKLLEQYQQKVAEPENPQNNEHLTQYIRSFILLASTPRKNVWFFGDKTETFGRTRSAKAFYNALTNEGARILVAKAISENEEATLNAPNGKNQNEFVSLLTNQTKKNTTPSCR